MTRKELHQIIKQELHESLSSFIKGHVSKEKALNIIKSHPTKNKLYKKLDSAKAEKFVQFIMKHSNCNYFKWDNSKKDFVATGTQKIKG